MPKQQFKESYQVDPSALGGRLDQVLAQLCSEISRSRLQDWIKQGHVSVDNVVVTKPRYKLIGGETIRIDAEIEQAGEWTAQNISLEIVFEDDHLLVINKPAGLVVHPAAGNPDGTMVNALLYHQPLLKNLPRAGIIHRLDKDTSGLLVVAKSFEAHASLVDQLQQRAFEREYQCICHGQMVSGGTIEAPIGRHPQNRLQMAVVSGGKPAITHYRLIEKFINFTHLQVNLETGRTHQIRVHMAHLHYPLVGDPLYGRPNYVPSGTSETLKSTIRQFRRQALHARKLGLIHPITGDFMHWEVEAPDDYQALLELLRTENAVQ
jgi:23S rRNA pseudouridine1911/1915/1917 synthase